jgi:protein-S-isoprenylcysteine O-methyltransferase Ste14
MILSFALTLFPFFFLVILFGGGALFRRKNINMDGSPPIDKWPFYLSKYSIVIIWAVMVLQCWNINLFPIQAPAFLKSVASFLWLSGFSLLYIGRFGMGTSFRIGSPKESTSLKTNGLFKLSRNPMYIGVYATILASVLYTLNPIVLFIGIFVVVVHHKIILSEEHYLLNIFGKDYRDYSNHVRRYL